VVGVPFETIIKAEPSSARQSRYMCGKFHLAEGESLSLRAHRHRGCSKIHTIMAVIKHMPTEMGTFKMALPPAASSARRSGAAHGRALWSGRGRAAMRQRILRERRVQSD
jgi:hypothetical protein